MMRIGLFYLIFICLFATSLQSEPTFLRHKTSRVGDVFFFNQTKLGIGTTTPHSFVDLQIDQDNKASIPLMKISQNVGTPSYGIVFSGESMTADPSTTMLRIKDVPSNVTIMGIKRSQVIFGSPHSDNSSVASVVVSGTGFTYNGNDSGDLLLRNLSTATSKTSLNIDGNNIPQFGRVRGRSGPAIFRIVSGSNNHDIRFGFEENTTTNDQFLRIYVTPHGKSERSLYIKLVSANVKLHSKTFVIDHPQNRHKYLVHGGIEGPENAVFYQGTASLKNGTATIQLPDYFETLTQQEGRTIRLTHIDGFDPITVKTSPTGKRIVAGAFTVVSSTLDSSQTFDWEVKATRADIPTLPVEPFKDDVHVDSMGPYSRLTSKGRAH